MKHHKSGGQRGVAAKIYLQRGRKPPYAITRVLLHVEGSFREVVFHRDVLHHGVRQPLRERADYCGVAGKNPIGECVNLIAFDSHSVRVFKLKLTWFYARTGVGNPC